MSILTGVASKHFKTFFYDIDDSIGMAWKGRYCAILPRHEALHNFGTVGWMQIVFAKAMEVNAGRLEHEGIERAMFEVSYDNCKDKSYTASSQAEFKIIKDSINVNQLEASIKQRNHL